MEVSQAMEDELSCYELWDQTWAKLGKWLRENISEIPLTDKHRQGLLTITGYSSDLILATILKDREAYDTQSHVYREAIRLKDVSFIYKFLPSDSDYGDELLIPDHLAEKGFLFLEVFLDLLDDIFNPEQEDE